MFHIIWQKYILSLTDQFQMTSLSNILYLFQFQHLICIDQTIYLVSFIINVFYLTQRFIEIKNTTLTFLKTFKNDLNLDSFTTEKYYGMSKTLACLYQLKNEFLKRVIIQWISFTLRHAITIVSIFLSVLHWFDGKAYFGERNIR